MASIRDVAKRAGVSITSVSRVLNNDKNFNISIDTKNKILNAIAELNYIVPNSYSKKNIKKNIFGCVQRLTVEGNKDNYFTTILSGVSSGLSSHGKSLKFVFTQFDFESNNYQNIFKTYPNGLIIMGNINYDAYKYLKTKIKYIVGIDTSYVDIDNIRYNRFEAGVQAVEYLIDCGHKQIGYIGANIHTDKIVNLGRYEAFNRVLSIHNLTINPNWIIDSKWEKQTCFNETVKLFQSENRPTALFVASDYMAITAIAAINSLGFKVPDDVSIIAISDIAEAAYTTPPLTTVSIPQKEIGKIAAETLLQRINGDSTITKQIYVPTKLIIRNSVKILK